MRAEQHYERWMKLAPAGLAIIGLGAVLISEAAIAKSRGKSWFWRGTAALIVLNTGISLVGGAAREQALYQYKSEAGPALTPQEARTIRAEPREAQ